MFLMLFTADDTPVPYPNWFLNNGGGLDTIPSDSYHPESDRLLPHNGRSIEFLNGMETVLQEGG